VTAPCPICTQILEPALRYHAARRASTEAWGQKSGIALRTAALEDEKFAARELLDAVYRMMEGRDSSAGGVGR
jgi:hypothetical protein